MEDINKKTFKALFTDACEKCFRVPVTSALSETDSKLLANAIFEQTGLVIGAKTIKNYSIYVLKNGDAKEENPSVATLDTLARYVLDAPYTDEVQRKNKESHFPYWFEYKTRFLQSSTPKKFSGIPWKKIVFALAISLVAVMVWLAFTLFPLSVGDPDFTDSFENVSEDSLSRRGWTVKAVDPVWWDKRDEKPGHLSLYTLVGDNWPNSENEPHVSNLLVREISSECFSVEIHLSQFMPQENWQQAGILLSEDGAFQEKTLRMAISYNDFFGGYEKLPEIVIQIVSSVESGRNGRPEEVAYLPLFTVTDSLKRLVESNLKTSALRIEKKGSHFRFLYTKSATESFAFHEVVSGDFDIQPRYVGLFAIKGWADGEKPMPAHFDSFEWRRLACGE